MMSALEISTITVEQPRRPHLRLVQADEIPARYARLAHARAVRRGAVKANAMIVSMIGVVVAAWVAMGWAFLAIPNTPLP
ncbi:MAG: hypothetical protein LBE83_03915 [Propionibacteriaceae bacterium]|nr:hypothetical protein [Propionibacteriaceae bacterium]